MLLRSKRHFKRENKIQESIVSPSSVEQSVQESLSSPDGQERTQDSTTLSQSEYADDSSSDNTQDTVVKKRGIEERKKREELAVNVAFNFWMGFVQFLTKLC